MSQITLYLDDDTQAMVDHAAKVNAMSKSRWVCELIRKHTATTWPADILSLAGRFEDFPLIDSVESASNVGLDVERLSF